MNTYKLIYNIYTLNQNIYLGGKSMDKTICQIIDSSGSLPQDFIKQYNISEVSFYFKFENTDYCKENIDYETTDFFKHMEEYPNDVPKTSSPNPYDWLSLFKEQYEKGARKYIVTTISSKLSTSFQTAISAKKTFEESNNDVHIEVIDSNTCACGQAALEIRIAKMIDNGSDFDSIIKMIHKMIPDTNTLFVVNSLKYMRAGGRIGGAAAFLGKVANIKPVCEFIDGEVHTIKPIIGRNKSLKTMVDIAISRIADINKTTIIIQNARSQKDADYILNYLREITNNSVQIFSSSLGIAVGSHSGPGTIGIGFVNNYAGIESF